MGPEELITLKPPVRDQDGNWTGGLLVERGDDRWKPVKEGTRCYTGANSYQAPRALWSPMAQAKVNGAISEANLIRKNLILESLGTSLGEFGLPHRDRKDSPARFTCMTMASRLPKDPAQKYILGKFYIPRIGIYFTLNDFDSLNFSGLNIHGGTPPRAPPGMPVKNDAVRITLIEYPPGAMGDGVGHLAVAALPGGSGKETVLKLTAEMQNLEFANFAQDGQVVNDTRSHVTFMARMLLLLVIWITNQLPFFYKLRIDSDQFLGAISFE
ncbi:hypothetical protein B0H19DRAFT_908759, partial [Mycena capillaripes]